MKLFYTDKPLFGLDISTTGIKMVAVNPDKNVVTCYGAIDLDPGKLQDSINKGDGYLAAGIGDLLKKHLTGHLHTNRVAMSVPTNHTYTRAFKLPIDAADDIAQSVQLEAEQYIPIPATELYIDFEEIGRTKESVSVLMSAVPRKIVDTLVAACEANKLEVALIESGISAVARIIKVTEEGHLPTMLVDVGAVTTDIAIMDGSMLISGGASVGGHTFTLKIAEKLKIGFEEAHQLKVHDGLAHGPRQNKLNSALSPTLNLIVNECRKMLRFYNDRLGAQTKIEQIILVGGGSNLPGIGEYMTATLLMPARVANPWQTLSFGQLQAPAKQLKARYVTAAGLALAPPKEIWQ